jgi:polar amino acid transport system ATP-binding protein
MSPAPGRLKQGSLPLGGTARSAKGAPMNAAVVSVQDVHKSFGTLKVLDGVSFEVERGQVVAVIGRSGSGKSTMLRSINRLEKIDSGSIEVCGHPVSSTGLDLNRLRRDVGIVFQSFNLFPHLSVSENVALGPRVARRMSRAETARITHEVLGKVNLLEKAEAYPEQLSGGQQQRVAIARSLAMEPQVMLFDEVTSALDPYLTGEVLAVMEQLATGGMTMIVVTHEMAFARKVADTVLFMHAGRIWEQGPAGMLDNPRTIELQQFIGKSS